MTGQEHEAAYRDALSKCFYRYANMTDEEELLEFILTECIPGVRDLPIPKLCRWLGYVQGVVIEQCFTTVQEERDWTRPLFRPLDFPEA